MRILLIDDSEIFLRALQDFLVTFPKTMVIGTYLSGDEALLHVQDLDPQIAFVDIEMTGIGGLETIRRLRIQLPQLTIIAMSMQNSDFREAALKAGANTFISKRFLQEELPPIMQKLQKQDNE